MRQGLPAGAYKGRRALVTGASAGLGAEFARQLAAAGADLVLVARRQEALEAQAAALRASYGVTVACLPADLSDRAAIPPLLAALEALGPVDVLINNAGAGGPTLLGPAPREEQLRYLELMMLSVTQLCQALAPPMAAAGWGRILNVASVAGRIGRAGDGHYGPAKAYVIALSEALHLDLRHRGVHVTALCPGFTHTAFHAEGELAAMKAKLPKFLWYDAHVVVREGLSALERNRAVYLSGRLYRWLDPFLQSVWLRPWLSVPARPQ